MEDGQGRAAGSLDVPVLLPPGLLGLTFYSQAFVFDATPPSWLTCSNLLVTQIGT